MFYICFAIWLVGKLTLTYLIMYRALRRTCGKGSYSLQLAPNLLDKSGRFGLKSFGSVYRFALIAIDMAAVWHYFSSVYNAAKGTTGRLAFRGQELGWFLPIILFGFTIALPSILFFRELYFMKRDQLRPGLSDEDRALTLSQSAWPAGDKLLLTLGTLGVAVMIFVPFGIPAMNQQSVDAVLRFAVGLSAEVCAKP